MRLKKRTLVLLGVMVVAIAASIGAYAYFTNSGTATDTAAVSVGSVTTTWTVGFTLDSAGGAIATSYVGGTALQPTAVADPNKVVATVPFLITNTEESDQYLNHWTASIDPASLPAGCTVSDFSVGGEAVGVSHTSAALGVTLKPASDDPANKYDDSVTVQMIESGSSQDGCQSVSPDLIVSATSS